MLADETRYHSQLSEFRSEAASADAHEDDLFFDCAGRNTPNLPNADSDNSGITLHMHG